MKLFLLFIKLLLTSLLVYAVVRVIRWFRDRQIVNKIPGPPCQFLIGNLKDVFGEPDTFFKNLRAISSQYKTIFRLWMGYISAVNLKTPEDIEIVISSTENLEKSQGYKPLLSWLNTGLLTSNGAKWHTRRKILTPAFHFTILQQFAQVFSKKTSILLTELDKHRDQNQIIDIVSLITMFSLDCICETSMGCSLNENDYKQKVYKQDIYKIGIYMIYRVVRPWLYPNLTFYLSPTFWKQRATTKRLHTFTSSVIKQRKETFSGSTNCTTAEAETTSKKRLAMLDLMLTAQKEGFDITDDGIREEVDTFMFEAHDTTSACICFTLMLLANHADVQQKVYEESMEAFGDSDRTPTYSDLQSLRYLEMCIKESLRLYPSVPLISRLASKDIDTFSGYRIPNRTHIHIHIYDLHHNPDVYPDPEKFDPERFLPENCIDRHLFAYLPFSGGPRNCIGQKFALLEIKALISGILRKYKLLPIDTPESIILCQDMILRPKGGLKIKFCQRHTA